VLVSVTRVGSLDPPLSACFFAGQGLAPELCPQACGPLPFRAAGAGALGPDGRSGTWEPRGERGCVELLSLSVS